MMFRNDPDIQHTLIKNQIAFKILFIPKLAGFARYIGQFLQLNIESNKIYR